jgi:prolyl-tRNA synthetase
VVADLTISSMQNFATGANEKNFHYINANLGRDFTVEKIADLRMVTTEDHCPLCGNDLELTRGIEVGHIFKLGTAYSEVLNARFLDSDGQEKPFIMGCYGIGVSRVMAAAIEQNHDKDGIVFPLPIAPFQVIILNLGFTDGEITHAAEALYQGLRAKGIDVLLDDRDERPGSKFKDADLIGIPIRVTVGKRFASDRIVEIRERLNGKVTEVPFAEASETLARMVMAP